MWPSAGSGKSTIAMQIAQSRKNSLLFSSDSIRGEIYGDENCQANPGRVFDILHQRVIRGLDDGHDVIMDATNLNCKRRMSFLKSIAHIDCFKKCVVVITTPEDIENRMRLRERKVPMEVVHRQLCQFQCPNYYEGWDEIEVVYNSFIEDCMDSYKKLWDECNIPHDNPHHTLSVREHMLMASEIIEKYVDDIEGLSAERWVACIHDIGKPRCKTFKDRNGNTTKVAHYNGHQNYGAYYSLIFDASNFDIPHTQSLDDACLVQWHMEHYIRKGEALEKFYKMIGPELSYRLRILEWADRAAH